MVDFFRHISKLWDEPKLSFGINNSCFGQIPKKFHFTKYIYFPGGDYKKNIFLRLLKNNEDFNLIFIIIIIIFSSSKNIRTEMKILHPFIIVIIRFFFIIIIGMLINIFVIIFDNEMITILCYFFSIE